MVSGYSILKLTAKLGVLSLLIRKCRRGNYDIGKLKGFLFRRGFSIDIINRVMPKVIEDTTPCLDR